MPTLYDKLWAAHVVAEEPGGALLYIDRMLLHEVSSPQAFAGLKAAGRAPRRIAPHLAVADHAVPTHDRDRPIADPQARAQVSLLEANCAATGIAYLPLTDERQGIVHVIGPEQGFTLPGATIVCGDSHTATHGAFGALAFGIGSEAECVLATQVLRQKRAKAMRVAIDGVLGTGVSAKDLALALIGRIGAGGGIGHAIEYAGSTVARMSMEARMTLCNMSIEAGSRTGLVAPDDTTFAWLAGKPLAPRDEDWTKALAYWRTLASDANAVFDREVALDAGAVAPQVTWGTSPDQVAGVNGTVPADASRKRLDYMGLDPGQPLAGIAVDHVFVGSCTNGRIEDLRAAAAVAAGRHVAVGVRALVVPGSGLVKRQAEAEGLRTIFESAGFEWRDPGCSLCVAMNDDRLQPGKRCASTSNRNFEGRQGAGARTYDEPRDGRRCGRYGADHRRAHVAVTPFTTLTATAAPFPEDNVDTDIILPARFLLITEKTGLGRYAFHERRQADDFVLDRPAYADAQILIAGANFGCGSSREQAPWALADMGYRAIIAPSFGEIFASNCAKNGMLAVVLADIAPLLAAAEAGQPVTVDLSSQTVTTGEQSWSFAIDASTREALLNGWDEVATILGRHGADIDTFEARQRAAQPWLWSND